MSIGTLLNQQQIEALLATSARPWTDRRRRKRRRYEAIQMVAPIVSDRLPSHREFRQVACRDISQDGIAFDWEKRPDFSEVVVVLGVRPNPIVVRARVMRAEPIADHSGRYVLGCQFTERVELKPPPAANHSSG